MQKMGLKPRSIWPWTGASFIKWCCLSCLFLLLKVLKTYVCCCSNSGCLRRWQWKQQRYRRGDRWVVHPLILKSLQKCCLKAYVLLNYQFLVNLEFLVICLQTFQNEPDSEMLLLTFHMSNIDNTFPTNIMVIKINYQYEPGFNCHMFIVSLLQRILYCH